MLPVFRRFEVIIGHKDVSNAACRRVLLCKYLLREWLKVPIPMRPWMMPEKGCAQVSLIM